jgi:hypothetical protein
MRSKCALLKAERAHTGLTDVSSLDRYKHTRHGLPLNLKGKEKLVQLTAKIRCNPHTSKIPVITGVRSRPFIG